MKIYNSSDQLLLDVAVDDSSYRYRVVRGEHNLTLKYALAEHVEIPVGAYCLFQGQRYTLERPESFKMKHSRNFEYTVIMESYQAKAKIWKFRNPVDGRLKFPLTAKPIEHLQMFVDNMNRRDSGWTAGECIDGVEHLISYDHDFCWDALGKMASEFETEFEIVGKRVSLCKVEYNKSNPLPLSYGCGNGFKPGLGRSNSSDTPPVEILYVQGGSDNIDRSVYGNGELLLPKGQAISYDGEHFEDDLGFNAANARRYVVDDLGLSVRRSDKALSSLAEDSLECSDIYPKRVGTVSSVVTVDAANHFYDIIDNSIPTALNYGDCLIAGETMTVIFQSGMLAGREFEVKYCHEAKTVKGVRKAARRFEIVPQEIDGVTMPDATFKPKAGDTYAVFKVMLPQAYIRDNATKSGAEWDMFRTAVKYLFDNEEQKFTFTGELDGIWAKKDWENIGGRIRLGGYILFRDDRFQQEGVLVRITGIKDYINKPHSPVIEISNNTVSSSFSNDLKRLQSEEVLIEEYHRDALQFTKRRFRDARETMEMLEASLLENFTNSVTPITVQTMAMLVGDESLQFRFVGSRTNPQTVAHSIVYDNTTRQLSAAAGLIQHLTLGIKSISASHTAAEYKYWQVQAYTSARLDDESKKYYLYIKASKSDETAEFILSEKAVKMEGVADYYHFLVGILNSGYGGERSFATLYGFTEVLPGRITTDRIVSSGGDSYFDMAADAMKLGSVFDFNSQGDGKLRLRGTLVQSEGGAESYIGCYRGVWNSAYTYYEGDEVSYTYQGTTSTYRYINARATEGHAPTETLYWQVTAAGVKGEDGTSVKIKGTAYYHYPTYEAAVADAGNIKAARGVLCDTNAIGSAPFVAFKYGHGWGTQSVGTGDGYIMDGTGDLWIASETSWQNVGNIKGNKGDKGDTGDRGAAGNYTELRFAKNGSTATPPSLNKTVPAPSGWSTTTPTVSKGEYLWVTTAVKSGDGQTLVGQWSTPFRTTPYDGKDGASGESPVMVYRGVYDSSKTYYGNKYRLDCVKQGTEYYIARIDAGTFSTPAPPGTSKWNVFGASFESIATNLLLAEGANIGDWFISQGRIVSTLESGKPVIILDANVPRIEMKSTRTGGGYGEYGNGTDSDKPSKLAMDALTGQFEARGSDGHVAYVSANGIFSNHAMTNALPESTGFRHYGSVVGIGFGDVPKGNYDMAYNQTLIAGVYGSASNTGTAPAFGGYFNKLFARGFYCQRRSIESEDAYSTQLNGSDFLVVGYNSNEKVVFLPNTAIQSQEIIVAGWMGGSIIIKSSGGQKLYHGKDEISSFRVVSGEICTCFFVVGYDAKGSRTEAWLCTSYKTGA